MTYDYRNNALGLVTRIDADSAAQRLMPQKLLSVREAIRAALRHREGDQVVQGQLLATVANLDLDRKLTQVTDELLIAQAELEAAVIRFRFDRWFFPIDSSASHTKNMKCPSLRFVAAYQFLLRLPVLAISR